MTKRAALFLDRDGTMIHDHIGGYVLSPEEVVLIGDVALALRQAKEEGYLLILVTNQAAIARGIATEEMVEAVNARLQELLSLQSASLDAMFYSPYHPEFTHPNYDRFKTWRKPDTGMVVAACDAFLKQGIQIDLSQSFFIGDKALDVECGKRAGMRSIFVKTGYGESELNKALALGADFVVKDITDAVIHCVLQNTASQREG